MCIDDSHTCLMGKKQVEKLNKFDREDLKAYYLGLQKKSDGKLPSYISKQFEVDELKEKGRIIYRMVPRENFNGTYIFYLYSSKLCLDMNQAEWSFITRLSAATGSALFVPMYPLAPEQGCKEVFEMLQLAYANCTKGHDVERLILMGCGYGAGLALSLTLLAWKEGWRKPDQLYLLSPCMDTEFFDQELEREMVEATCDARWNFFNGQWKDFLNTYWVKDYAVKTEYTSPYYEDLTDLCDDVILFSGVQDIYHCYSREFYKKAKQSGVSIRYFEIEGEAEDFLIYGKNQEHDKAWGFLVDCINHTYNTSLREIYPIKLMSDWTKKFPEYFRDDWASKFIYDNKFNFKGLNTRLGEYNNIRLAASYCACDAMVARFIQEYPNGTVVHLGCRLGNMFGRMDNGRIQWYNVDTHNIMSIRRSMYGERSREKTIGRRLMDFTWLDEIICKQNQGVMFVCNDSLTYLANHQVRDLIEEIADRFPGSQLVFTVSTGIADWVANMHKGQTVIKRKKKKFGLSDAERVFGAWRSDYRIMDEAPTMRYIGVPKKSRLLTKFMCRYNLVGYNHRVVRVKLGNEEYKINFRY